MSSRWVYRGNDLRNTQRPVSPKFVVITSVGNGVPNVPPRGKRRKPFGGR